MIIVYGNRLYGTVERCGTSRIATRFFHIYGMPLLPLGSVLVTEEGEDNSYRGIPLGLHLRSLLAGYARLWLPLVAVGMLIAALSGSETYAMDEEGISGKVVALAGLGIAGLVGSIWAWVRFGKLSLEERAQRMVYADFTGIPADVALLGESRSSLREKLLALLEQRAPEVAATGYRIGVDAAAGWDRVALEPSVRDRNFVATAFTVARLEWALARGPRRAASAELHARLWSKLRELDPNVLVQAETI
ncbi:MAG TPA: hypothetical protein VH877_17535 [Polyangia bacterium]|jgi:hypothetical protein|nr:hypothetical protein [Polyangia bacterium]